MTRSLAHSTRITPGWQPDRPTQALDQPDGASAAAVWFDAEDTFNPAPFDGGKS